MSRRKRAQVWVLRVAGDGLFDVLRNGRQLQADLSEAAARNYIARHRIPTDKLVAEDASGLRSGR